MLSYLGIIQSLVDSTVYARGVRLYLEGKIGLPSELDLEYWREYEVYDRVTHFVQLPVLHLALKREMLEVEGRVGAALTQYARCDCEYYQEMGLCKHIVGVCASLEQEFGIKDQYIEHSREQDQKLHNELVDNDSKENGSILDRIFEVEVDKKSRAWEHDFEAYLSQSGERIPHSLKNMITAINKETILYSDLLHYIQKYSLDATRTFEKERNLVRFILFTLHYNNPVWVELWLGLLSNLGESNRRKVILELWIIIKSGANKSVADMFGIYLKNLSNEDKNYFVTELQSIYQKNKDIWLDFVFVSEAKEWIKDNYQELDPMTLLRFAPLIPDSQEDIEITILNQLKQWGDFLIGSDYQYIIDVFEEWQGVLGRSSYYEEAVIYYRSIHSKKRKLILAIDK